MSKQQVCAVVGANGIQGRAVARAMSEAGFRVRALTPDPESSTAQESIRGLANSELVRFDINDLSSVRSAFDGAHIVFAVTVANMEALSVAPGNVAQVDGLPEVAQGRRLVDAAKEKGVKIFIWSTLPLGANLKSIGHFQAKAEIQKYIVEQGQPAVFVAPGIFFENWIDQQQITKFDSDKLQLNIHRANRKASYFPLYVEADLGRVVALLVDNFEKVKGKTIKAFERKYSIDEMVAIVERETGKKVVLNDKVEGIAKCSEIDQMWESFADSKVTTYEGGDAPDETLKSLGFTFTPLRRFIKEKLKPYITSL